MALPLPHRNLVTPTHPAQVTDFGDLSHLLLPAYEASLRADMAAAIPFEFRWGGAHQAGSWQPVAPALSRQLAACGPCTKQAAGSLRPLHQAGSWQPVAPAPSRQLAACGPCTQQAAGSLWPLHYAGSLQPVAPAPTCVQPLSPLQCAAPHAAGSPCNIHVSSIPQPPTLLPSPPPVPVPPPPALQLPPQRPQTRKGQDLPGAVHGGALHPHLTPPQGVALPAGPPPPRGRRPLGVSAGAASGWSRLWLAALSAPLWTHQVGAGQRGVLIW